MISRMSNREIAILGGVLAGIAYKVGLPTWVVRLAFIGSVLITFSLSVLIYIVLWVVMPPEYMSKSDFDLNIGTDSKDKN